MAGPLKAIGDADDITIGKRDVALFAKLAATMALETAAESIADEPGDSTPTETLLDGPGSVR